MVDSKNRRYLLTLREGGEFHTHAGVIPHASFVGRPEGTTLRSTSGARYLTLRPTLSDFVLSMPRGAQVVYPKDLGPLLMLADVRAGARILEAGVGSGALSMAMLQAGASVTGYEIRADFAATALRNVHAFLGPDVDYRIEERDVYEGIDETGPRPRRARPARAVAGGQARRGRPPPGRDLRVLPAHHRPGGPAARGAGGERLRPGPDRRGAPAVVARRRASRCAPTTAWWPTPGSSRRPASWSPTAEPAACPARCHDVNALDLAVVAVVASSMVGGYRLGLVTGGTSCVLLLQGLVLATLAVPSVVAFLGGTNPTVRLSSAPSSSSASATPASTSAAWPAPASAATCPSAPTCASTGSAGAAAAPFAVLLGLWLLVLPALSDVSGRARPPGPPLGRGPHRRRPPARPARRLPGPPPPGRAGRQPPGVRRPPARPSTPARPPPPAPLSPATVARVTASTVKVEGTACRSERDGSGFSVAPDLVMTNAHVVAGQDEHHRRAPRRRPAAGHRGRLRPRPRPGPAVGAGPGPAARWPSPTARSGTTVAVFGHPGGQNAIQVSPASIRQQVKAVGRGLYGSALVRRSVYVLAADLAPGDSGAAPGERATGEVVGVAFAIAPDRDTTAYALTAEELRPILEPSAEPG